MKIKRKYPFGRRVGKRLGRNEHSLRNMWNSIKSSKYVMEMPEKGRN